MAIPERTTDIQTYNGDRVVCAKFTVYDSNTKFKITRVAFSNGDYQFQMVVKGSSNATIGVLLGGVEKSISVSPGFTKQTVAFTNLDVTSSSDLSLIFPAGTFWLYNLQLEEASSPSSWRPAPEDSDDHATEIARSIVDAQTQESIFYTLTNGGQTQGMYLKDGRVYINASYINTGTLQLRKGNYETFYANVDTGVIRIVADELSITGRGTVATEKYADEAADEAVEAQTQLSIFNKLTNNGETQGLYLSNNKIYINAAYIAAGILADAGGNMSWNLATGALSAKQLSIDSTYFKLTTTGDITATSGTFNNVTIQSGCDVTGVSSQVVSNARTDIENIVADTVDANYITSKSAVLGKMSIDNSGYVYVDGSLRARNNLYASTVEASTFSVALAGGATATGTDAEIKLGTATWVKFNKGIYTGADVTISANSLVNILDTATNLNAISEWYVSRGYITLYEDSNTGVLYRSWRTGTVAAQIALTNVNP